MCVAPDDPQPSDPRDLAAWLRGQWRITRVINDGAGRFSGHALFTPDPESPTTTIWREQGRLRLAGHDGPAARTLRLAPGIDGGGWQVCFADGRPFHALDLTDGRCSPVHHCGEDVYRGEFALEHADRFTVTWRVTGPRKDDVIASVYERLV